MNLAVAFFTFNRLDTTIQVFETIRMAKPDRLYLISDGPRKDNASDVENINRVRDYVENSIDWTCEVKKNYASFNMGCMDRIASGISWVFEFEEAAVILEDDIKPTPDFYDFMQAMLERYQNDENIMLVSGFKIINSFPIEDSYTFSNFPMIWGWATWRRAWEYFDKNIADWPEIKKRGDLKKYFNFWGYLVEVIHLNEIYYKKTNKIWDYQWTYAVLKRNGLAIIPKVNLIENLGIGHAEATNTGNKLSQDFTTHHLERPYRHPQKICANKDYDAEHLNNGWGTIAIIKKIFRRILRKF